VAEERERTRTTVDIYGEQYTIVGDENPDHVRKVASLVDEKMREIKRKNPYLDTKKLAVLTAVNIVNEYIKLKDHFDQAHKANKEDEEST